MTDRKIISRRKMHGLNGDSSHFAQIQHWPNLSTLMDAIVENGGHRIHLAGPLDLMTRVYVEEPLGAGWKFARPYVHKHRTPTYEREDGMEMTVKLIGHRESWFPGCEDQVVACEAWKVLESEWKSSTGLPLLSSPAATGKALLWETLPKDRSFPALPDDLARLIRSNSPQHRLEVIVNAKGVQRIAYEPHQLHQYDGRWMYAAMCGLDRFPVGEPRRVDRFTPYQPGWHFVEVRIPNGWNHIGLLPAKSTDVGWDYPAAPGLVFKTWASEPELTLALFHGWEIVEHMDGWAFDKGRPLDGWSKKLIDLRAKFQAVELNAMAFNVDDAEVLGSPKFAPCNFAAAAVRQILNHTIGAMHVDGYEREVMVPDAEWRQWRRDNAEWFNAHDSEHVEGGYVVSQIVPSESKLDIYMPHWSSTIYALSRARVAQWALKCDPSTLVKINGDAIYSTAPLPFEDNGNLGQLRRKEL